MLSPYPCPRFWKKWKRDCRINLPRLLNRGTWTENVKSNQWRRVERIANARRGRCLMYVICQPDDRKREAGRLRDGASSPIHHQQQRRQKHLGITRFQAICWEQLIFQNSTDLRWNLSALLYSGEWRTCAYVYVCICRFVCLLVHFCVYVCICMCVCLHTLVCMFAYVCMFACVYVCICIHMLVYMFACADVCVCVCVCIYFSSGKRGRYLTLDLWVARWLNGLAPFQIGGCGEESHHINSLNNDQGRGHMRSL